MTAATSPDRDSLVLLLPATRRDGEAICTLLEREGLSCLVCLSTAAVATELGIGAGALVLTDSALMNPGVNLIIDGLTRQPPWSDLPVMLLSKAGAEAPEVARIVNVMTNVTLLDRPSSTRTLLSAIHTALRARGRQYQMRDQLLALRDAENALRVSDRRKDEFLAMLAHELRNPLAPIRTASELLPHIVPTDDPRIQSTLGIVSRQVTQLTRLVDDLLDVSRITQGRIQMQRSTLEASAILTQALESVEPLVREKRHKVLRSLSMQPLYVEGDNARLVQSVSNILLNAVKYTDEAGEIRVDLRQEQSYAVISVQDNGVGITPELLPKVFELFVQSERSLDRSQGGLGIGLCIVKRLVEMHLGEVTAFSAGANQGSTFEIRLPLVAAPLQAVERLPQNAVKGRRVLIVDDNEDAANTIALLLKINGHEVETAYGAHAALERAVSFNPDMVLLDIGLPVMTGYEVVKRLRADGSMAQLVALSGYGQAEDIQRAREAGFDAHLVKPVDFSKLEQMLQDVVL